MVIGRGLSLFALSEHGRSGEPWLYLAATKHGDAEHAHARKEDGNGAGLGGRNDLLTRTDREIVEAEDV